MTMEAVQQSVLNDLALLGDSLNRMEYLLECGKETPGLSPAERAAAETVPDCQVNTWIDAKWSNGVLTLRTDSESLIVRGALALLEEIFSARSAAEIAGFACVLPETEAFSSLLNPVQRKGLDTVLRRLRAEAEREAAK